MATRFTKEESILALAHLAAHKDDYTDTETAYIDRILKSFYHLDEKTDWNNFIDKWNTLSNHSDIERACINTLKKCNYDMRVKACAAIWAVSYHTDKYWSVEESELFWRVMKALNVKKDDAKAEFETIGRYESYLS